MIAGPAIRQVAEKSFFGKPFTRIGRLFNVVGYWVYQEGGVLGYALRDKPALLWKLAAPAETPNISEAGIVKEFMKLSGEVASALEETKNEEKTFYYLYTMRELRDCGIKLNKWPPDKKLEDKADVKLSGDVMRISFAKGITLGFNFPEQFYIYWENTYRMRPDSEWEEMRKKSIVFSDKQQKRTLNEAIIEIAENAIAWSAGDTPIKFDNNDIEALESLISIYKNKRD
ncbi:hypothetical protein ACFLV0_06970 [Chloroflexota bacterium]